MRSLRAITLALVFAAWAAGAVAACLLPGSQLSEEEKACCRQMASECGQQMQASHSCCAKSVRHDQSSLAARGDELHPELAVALPGSLDGSGLQGERISLQSFAGPSPPGPAPGFTTILRI